MLETANVYPEQDSYDLPQGAVEKAGSVRHSRALVRAMTRRGYGRAALISAFIAVDLYKSNVHRRRMQSGSPTRSRALAVLIGCRWLKLPNDKRLPGL